MSPVRQSAIAIVFLPFIFGQLSRAEPPGALVDAKVFVPESLRAAPFNTDRFVKVPPGFEISVWARLPSTRLLTVAPNGDVFVSQPSSGRVTGLRPDAQGGLPTAFTYVSGLREPHGLGFDQQDGVTSLYVAETHRVVRYPYHSGDTSAPPGQVAVSNLPEGGHPLKSIAISPDHHLFVGIGSSCNACPSDTTANPARASIWRYNADGSAGRLFAAGLRNPEGMAFVPGTVSLWAAVNNRDELPYALRDASGRYGQLVRAYVDDHPPDLLTAVRDGGNYGWPFCNSDPDTPSGMNMMPFNPDPENDGDASVNCLAMDRASKGIQAHSAPLGLAFLNGSTFPAPWRDGVTVAYHGSWDRTVPTGYKVVWFPWDNLKQTAGVETDLVTSFTGWGRPVATAVLPDGTLLITDDAAGAIYRLRWNPSAISAASGYPIIAPGSYAAVYGSGLAGETAATGLPYPETLGGISLTITDAAGHGAAAPLVFVSASQINFLVPAGLSEGTARLTLTASNGQSPARDLGSPELRTVAPGLFSKASNGIGEAVAVALDQDGNQLDFPIDLSGGTVYLSLFGTGIRAAGAGEVQVLIDGLPVPVLYAGAQPTFPGLDQINVKLPAELRGAGQVSVQVAAHGWVSNAVTIQVR